MKRWAFRLGIGFAVLLVAGFAVRTALLPDVAAMVFVDYAGGAAWAPAPESPLFAGGEIDFAGYEPVQLAGEDYGAWDEVVIVSFARADDYQRFARRLASAGNVARYHLMEIAPRAPELLYFTNWRLRSYRDDPSIEPGGRVPIERVVPDAKNLGRWRALFDGPYRDSIVMLNLLRYAEEPEDPAGESGADASGEALYERYSRKATRLLGRLGGQILVLGGVDRVVAGPPGRAYDVYAFVFYPSVDVFEVMFTAAERVEAQVYQRAGLSAEGSAGYWVKPYPAFVPRR